MFERVVRQIESPAPAFIRVQLANKRVVTFRHTSFGPADGVGNRLGKHQFLRAGRERFVNDDVPQLEPAQIEPFDCLHDAGLFEFRQMDDERLQSPLDFGAQSRNGFLPVNVMIGDEFRHQNRLAKMHQHRAAVPLLCRIGQAHRNNLQSEASAVAVFQLQSHSRRAGLDRLELRIVIGDALGENAYRSAAFEDFEARLEGVHHRTHRPRIVLQAIDGNDPALLEQPCQRSEPEQLHGGYEMHRARNQGSDDERVRN